MKIVINNEVGVFHYTTEQMRYMKELADMFVNELLITNMEHESPYDDELARMINERADDIGKCDEFYDFYPSHIDDFYKYRSHRWVIEACEAHPDKSQRIEEIDDGYYNIIEHEDGTEHIITPSLDNFIKGFE